MWLVALFACTTAPGPDTRATTDPGLPPAAGAAPVSVAIGGVPAATLPDVAERVTKSVVSVRVEKDAPVGHRGFRDLRGRFDGVGSGVVVREDGVVLTNHHVVADAISVEVTTWDGRTLAATVAGSDPNTDVAVLRLVDPPDDLPPIDLGQSAGLRVGEVVLAVGNPFGVGQTVTLGIVSGLGRTGLGLAEYEDFIQTDAAVNPGNSGGALVDLSGRLVGINSAIRSESGGNEGIAFAIPVDRARRVADLLLATGAVHRGFLGVAMQPADDALARKLGVPAGGVVVTDVVPDSPAALAGLRSGDVIVGLDGAEVRDLHRFRYEVATSGAGHSFAVDVLRDGERVALRGTLGAVPGEAVAADPGPEIGGARLLALDDAARERFHVPAQIGGLVASEIGDGPMALAGVTVGDVILDVEHHDVRSLADLRAMWARASGSAVLLRVWRDGDIRFVAVPVP